MGSREVVRSENAKPAVGIRSGRFVPGVGVQLAMGDSDETQAEESLVEMHVPRIERALALEQPELQLQRLALLRRWRGCLVGGFWRCHRQWRRGRQRRRAGQWRRSWSGRSRRLCRERA